MAMKKLAICFILAIFTIQVYAQWNPTGNNTTTGNVSMGSYLSIKGGDDNSNPPRIYMAMKDIVGYYGDIAFRYENSDKKVTIRSEMTSTGGNLTFLTFPSNGGFSKRMTITGEGKVGIGTTNPTGLLDVAGDIKGTKLDIAGPVRSQSVTIEATGWSDFVFDEDYRLPALSEVENHIKTYKHLPDVPSEKQVVEEGVNVVEMQAKLLQKIEELTLYVIEQDKEIKELKKILNKE